MEILKGIYGIFCLASGKVYIGSSGHSCGIQKRFRYHLNGLLNNRHPNKHLQAAWNKYGELQFEFRILQECEDADLITEEQRYMDLYNSMSVEHGYNFREAGSNGKMSQETKNKISIAHRGKKLSESHKQKLSQSGINRILSAEALQRMKNANVGNTYRLGKHHSDEAKQKMRDGRLGKKSSEETRQKISLALKGRPILEETRQKISIKNKGRKLSEETKQKIGLSFAGKTLSEETKQKIRSSLIGKTKGIKKPSISKPVNMFTLDGVFEREFDSITAANIFFNRAHSHISACCRGKRKKEFGHKWAYKEIE